MTGIIKTDQIQGAGSSTVTIPSGTALNVTTVSGTPTFSGNVSMSGTAAITGNTTVGGTLVNTGLITASAGVAVGGTGAVNTLDDYEEGTFTGTLVASGSTFQYSYQTGRYTKVGNLVNFNLYIQLDGGGNSFVGNAVTITGMPFTNRNNANDSCRFYVHGRYLNVDGTNYYYVYAHLSSNSTTLSLNMGGDNVPGSALPATYLSSSSGQLLMNGHYFTDA